MSSLTVWVTADALGEMFAEAERMHPLETGGMLLGWTNDEGDERVVVAVIGPGAAAVHGATSFVPDAVWQQHELEVTYNRSDRKVTYLGDWHVHPMGAFGMSRRDRRTMRTIASEKEARCPTPLMGLVAPDGDGELRFGVWKWRASRVPFHVGYADPIPLREWKLGAGERFW